MNKSLRQLEFRQEALFEEIVRRLACKSNVDIDDATVRGSVAVEVDELIASREALVDDATSAYALDPELMMLVSEYAAIGQQILDVMADLPECDEIEGLNLADALSELSLTGRHGVVTEDV